MATTTYLLPIFFLLLSLADANIKPSRGVTLQLVHRFSPSLPFHKSDNFVNFLERNDENIAKRIASVQQDSIDVQLITPTSDKEHLFFVNLSIGEPPVTQYLAMDTGSRLIWVIGDSLRREFKYSLQGSSTSSYVTCVSDTCQKLSNTQCTADGKCIHQTGYGDRWKVFAHEAPQGGTGVIIDSGSIATYVAEKAFDKLYPLISTELKRRDFYPREGSHCFVGTVEEVKQSDFPILSFDFAQGASLQLDEDDLFIDHNLGRVFCLTVRSSATHGPTMSNLTVIGLTAQQDYVIGYDLENLRLSMKYSNL